MLIHNDKMSKPMQRKRIYFFIGTTAELIKVAPIMKELKRRKITFKLIFSGQRRINFDEFRDYISVLKPSISLSERGYSHSLIFFALWAIKATFDGIFTLRKEFKGLKKSNSYFIIHGDTFTSFIGSVIATFFNLKLVHVESGALSFNLLEPFPEEMIKIANIHLADVLFAPNNWAKNNLRNIKGTKIDTKQNTLIETFRWSMTNIKRASFKKYKNYYILLLHRQEHVVFKKTWSRKTLEFIIKNADPNLNCILIKHPLSIKVIKSLKLAPYQMRNVKIISPLSYLDFMSLMHEAQFIATDSAFNQLESYLMGLPFLSLRNHIEQIEGLGNNVVIAKNNLFIIKSFLNNYQKYRTKPLTYSSKPSKIIVDYLMNH